MEVVRTAGLSIFIDSQPVHHGMGWSTVTEAGFWCGSVLRGRVGIEQAQTRSGDWAAGSAAHFWSDTPVEISHLALEDGEICGVFVHIALEDFEALVGTEALAGVEAGQRRGNRIASVKGRQLRATTHTIAWQMFGCPLSGAARRLYLGGKALEMIAHLLQLAPQVTDASAAAQAGGRVNEKGAATQSWTPKDIEAFHHARSILLSRLHDPPSVPELARSVGVNVRKLSRGFVDLFGQPVYSFVKARRLEGARLMIEAGETSIARVAYAYGYQPGHFATEFRKRFGISPTTLAGRPRGSMSSDCA